MKESLYIITIYKPPKMGGGEINLGNHIKKHALRLSNYFNWRFPYRHATRKTLQSTTFQNLMYKYKLKHSFSESTTINNT
jgi:hypothetical protein